MTDHNLEKSEIKGTICLITNVQGYTLLVFKDFHGYFFDVIAPSGNRYCRGDVFFNAASAETKGREWVLELMEDEDEFELEPDE